MSPDDPLLRRLELIAKTSLNRETECTIVEAMALIRQLRAKIETMIEPAPEDDPNDE